MRISFIFFQICPDLSKDNCSTYKNEKEIFWGQHNGKVSGMKAILRNSVHMACSAKLLQPTAYFWSSRVSYNAV